VHVRLVLASATIAVGLYGCTTPVSLARPSLGEQARTREINVVAAREEPALPWQTAPGSQGALVEALLAAGASQPHVRFGSATPGATAGPTYAVGVSGVRWIGESEADRPFFLAASVFATRSSDGEGAGASLVVHLTDPVPHTREEWLADGARAARASLASLMEVGAGELVAELTSVVGPVAVQPGEFCGLTPSEELLELQLTDAPGVVRWAPFATEGEAGVLRVTYDVRVWRFDGSGPTLVLERTGLSEPVVEVSLTPGVEHGLSARARIDLGGERSWTTPWSARARKGDLCRRQVEPLGTLRKLVWARDGSELAPPKEPSAPPPGSTPIELTSTNGTVSVRVAAGQPSVVVGPTAGPPVSPRIAPAERGAAGAVGGLVASVLRCGPFALFCAPVLVPLGALDGATKSIDPISYREQLAAGAASDYLRELHWALGTAARDPATGEALVEALRAARLGEPVSGPEAAAPTLELEWTRVAFREITYDEASPAATLQIELAATLRREGSAPERRSVVVDGPGPLPRTFWLGDDRAPLRGAVRAQLARAARQLLEDFGVGRTAPRR
jgi:hypothetical protein